MNIIELRRKGIDVFLEYENIRCRASKDVLTQELLEEIREHKTALIEELKEPFMLREWRRSSIPHWIKILKESIRDQDDTRRDYATWMLEEVLHYVERTD